MSHELRSQSLDYLAERYKPVERVIGIEKPFVLFLGVSGVGKSTIMRQMIDSRPDLYTYISPYTTRPLREGETDKTHVSAEQYQKMLDNHEFAYDNPLYNVRYGTPKKAIANAFENGQIPLLDFPLDDVPKLDLPDDVTPLGIYCFPPDINEWYARMAKDGRQNLARLKRGYRELEKLVRSHKRLPNIDLGLVTRNEKIADLAEQTHEFILSLR